MKIHRFAFVAFLALAAFASTASAQYVQYVSGYFRADGTWVQGYYRNVPYPPQTVQTQMLRAPIYQGVNPVLQGMQQAQEQKLRQLEIEQRELELQRMQQAQSSGSDGGG